MVANLQVKKAIKVTAAVLILLLTLFLSYYNFGNDGYGNAYYTAAIKSMTLSWHNFFFVSFDPGGFVSVDKPPVALWLQVIFVKLFGFHTWSIMLPEALAAVAAVAIVYHLVEKNFGFIAGITAACMLAITPIFIAASRSNNPDAILVFILILSAWAVLVAAERGQHHPSYSRSYFDRHRLQYKMAGFFFNRSRFHCNLFFIKHPEAFHDIDLSGACRRGVEPCFFFMGCVR